MFSPFFSPTLPVLQLWTVFYNASYSLAKIIVQNNKSIIYDAQFAYKIDFNIMEIQKCYFLKENDMIFYARKRFKNKRKKERNCSVHLIILTGLP